MKSSLERALQLRAYAARMRSEATASEAALWSALRGKQLGVHFRRQMPLLDSYIADFFAPSARLIVEVDGDYHQQRRRPDQRRDRRLSEAGFRTVRLPAELVLNDMPSAVALITSALQTVRARPNA